MSLQWTAVATFLYAEVFATLLLCVPFISPTRVGVRVMGLALLVESPPSSLISHLVKFSFLPLPLSLADAGREVRKYSVTEKVDLTNNPTAVEHIHMKLFRAQRNLYIAGFALLLWFLLRRLVTLLSQQACMIASNEAFKKQAEGASTAAKKYMEENETLQETLREAGIAAPEAGKKAGGRAGVEEENKKLKGEVHQLKDELDTTKKALQKCEGDVKAIKKQAENLTREYDRLLDEHSKLQVSAHPGATGQ
ncbi:BAP31 protein, partial [Amia calva]|nr:BAP31 protein [Amia calva]